MDTTIAVAPPALAGASGARMALASKPVGQDRGRTASERPPTVRRRPSDLG